MAEMWYYSSNGTQIGPVSEDELLRKFRAGEVNASDLVWKDSMIDWVALGHVPELQSAGVSAMVPRHETFNGNVPLPQPPARTGHHQVPQVPTYLWQAICVTFLCCLPFGIVAIVYASKVDGLLAQGDTAGAMTASKTARLWVNLSAGSSLLVILFALISTFFGAPLIG